VPQIAGQEHKHLGLDGETERERKRRRSRDVAKQGRKQKADFAKQRAETDSHRQTTSQQKKERQIKLSISKEIKRDEGSDGRPGKDTPDNTNAQHQPSSGGGGRLEIPQVPRPSNFLGLEHQLELDVLKRVQAHETQVVGPICT